MVSFTQDLQLSNLLARARVSPYFDLENALHVLMESWMHQHDDARQSAEQLSGAVANQTRSVVKIFTWPSEELCACLHKAEEDHLYLYVADQHDLVKIESDEPMLLPVEHGDRIVVLNDALAKHLEHQELEKILHQHAEEPDYVLEKELCLRARVNVRSQKHIHPNSFAVSTLKVYALERG
jgi:hypothetical protein